MQDVPIQLDFFRFQSLNNNVISIIIIIIQIFIFLLFCEERVVKYRCFTRQVFRI